MQSNIPKEVVILFYALQQEFDHVQFLGSIRQKPYYLKHEYAFNVDGRLFSVWQTHNGEWWWSNPIQTQQNLRFNDNRSRLVN